MATESRHLDSMTAEALHRLSDRELIAVTIRAAADERRSTVELVELLAELDARRLYLGQGCSSLFTYCTEVLRLSESAAYHRIEAARAIRLFPLIGERLRDGSMTLTTVALLRPHLTLKNHGRLIDEARHKSKREVEQQIARLAPKPDVPTLIRRLPDTAVTSSPLATPRGTGVSIDIGTCVQPDEPAEAAVAGPPLNRRPQPKIEPLTEDRYLLRLSLSATGHENLRRAQNLMRHSLPSGDLSVVLECALELLIEHLERRKFAATARPPTSSSKPHRLSPGKVSASRHLSAALRRTVWKRDGGRCAFIGPHGRCTETGRLEFHHVVPFARGGGASPNNIALRCRAHNVYEGELCFGRREPTNVR
jgi:hypothetical protein